MARTKTNAKRCHYSDEANIRTNTSCHRFRYCICPAIMGRHRIGTRWTDEKGLMGALKLCRIAVSVTLLIFRFLSSIFSSFSFLLQLLCSIRKPPPVSFHSSPFHFPYLTPFEGDLQRKLGVQETKWRRDILVLVVRSISFSFFIFFIFSSRPSAVKVAGRRRGRSQGEGDF